MKKRALTKVFSILMSVCLFFGLNSCAFFDMQPDFHISSMEMMREYFPKYVDGVAKIIDEYIPEYTIETEEWDIENEGTDRDEICNFKAIYTIDEKFHVDFYIRYHEDSSYTYFRIALRKYSETDFSQDIQSICTKYQDMLYKICQFCCYKVDFDVNEYLTVCQDAHDDYKKSDNGIGIALISHDWLDDWQNVWSRFSYNESSYPNLYYFAMGTGWHLSDENVWTE